MRIGVRLRKTRKAFVLAKRREFIAPARKEHMRIGLMTHIEDELIFRGIDKAMDRKDDLDRSQT